MKGAHSKKVSALLSLFLTTGAVHLAFKYLPKRFYAVL
jgi:hypothetical protein